MRALLVEDEVIIALVRQYELRQLGWTVDVASTGEEAIELARKTAYDAIIMDIHLAGLLSGIDAALTIQSICPPKLLVFLTAYADSEIEKFLCLDKLLTPTYLLDELLRAKLYAQKD